MSGRLPIVDNLCRNPENHRYHLCELKAAGRDALVATFEKNPLYVCGNCGSKANTAGALCAPGPLQADRESEG